MDSDDLARRANDLRGIAARARRLACSPSLSAKDAERILEVAADLDREASELEMKVGSR